MIELKNVEIYEFCTLDDASGEASFSKNCKKKVVDGHYFKDDKTFFALYETEEGPMMYYEGKKYSLTQDLSISLEKQGKNRTFRIDEYDIKITYKESPYIGFDVWSDEIDVDLFYRIEQSYKNQEFFDKYTIKSEST